MANVKSTNTNKKVETVVNPIVKEVVTEKVADKDQKIQSLELQLAELKGMINSLANAQNSNNNNQTQQVINPVLKMDKPCTLVHLTECARELPDTIFVNKIKHEFSRFGETRTFRFADMQNIVSTYHDWFDRGIFALGNDCDEFEDEFSVNSIKQIPVSTYKKMETLTDDDFEKLIKGLNEVQKVHFARTWIQRYLQKQPGYNNINKIRLLNKYTKTSEKALKGLIGQMPKVQQDYILENKQIFKDGVANVLLAEVESESNEDEEA
jgi:hypothetical protein